MWHSLRIEGVGKIEKTVAEFTIWMVGILPYAKMKVKIYEDQSGVYTGVTDIRIRRKFDGCPESAIGHGNTVEETLSDTIKHFNDMLKEDGFIVLTEDDIEYSAFSDF